VTRTLYSPGNLLKVICESLQNFKFLIRLLFKAHAIVDSVSSLIAATVQPLFSLSSEV
jgi:hypothetical protein